MIVQLEDGSTASDFTTPCGLAVILCRRANGNLTIDSSLDGKKVQLGSRNLPLSAAGARMLAQKLQELYALEANA